MAARILPTPEQLRQLLRYDPETGKLFWKERPLSMFPRDCSGKTWNTRYSGKEALSTIDAEGYKFGTIFGWQNKAHRVAWALFYGEWPEKFIDHINGDPGDNRLTNLRVASNAQNLQNSGRRSDNTSGYKGVGFYKRYRKWRASIRLSGRPIHIGYFDTPEAAHAAYCEAAKKYHGEFARLE